MISRSYLDHYKKTFLLAYPVIISQVGHTTVALVDSLMIGKLGTVSLAACALGNSIFTLFMVFGIGISYGLTPLVAQADGRKQPGACASLLEQSLFLNILTGFILFGIIYLVTPLLYRMGQSAGVAEQAVPFMRIIGFSIIPLMIFLTFKQFAEGLAFTRQAMYISIAGNLLTILLNYLLIYGHLGFPKLGLAGAGWSNLFMRICMAAGIAWYVLKAPAFRVYLKRLHWENMRLRLMRNILKIGLPIGLQYVFEISAFTIAAVIIGWIGAAELAAHQIAISLAALTYMASSGISSATTVRIGNAFGKNDTKALRMTGFSSYYMVILFMAVNGCLFILLNTVLPAFYIADPEVTRIASSLIIIAAFFQISDGTQVVGLGALRGLGDVRIPTAIVLIAYWVLAIPLGYFFGFKLGFGVQGVWYGLLTGLSVAAILLFGRFYYFTGKMAKRVVRDEG